MPVTTAGGPAPMQPPTRLFRWLFALTLVWGAAVMWIAARPPMIDLPQHAAQVALLQDLIAGRSPWVDLVRVNLLTPYLIGYGAALVLGLLLPIAAAFKALISIAFLLYVWIGVLLRRHFGGDARLDWLFIAGFFGFTFNWGFLTFFVAAPLGMLFMLVSDRYAMRPTRRGAALLILTGLVVLVSHGLVFVFAWIVSAGLMVLRLRQAQHRLAKMLPLVATAAVCLAYFVVIRRSEQGMPIPFETIGHHDSSWRRIVQIVLFSIESEARLFSVIPAIMLFAAPWLLGLRMSLRRPETWLALAAVLLIFALVPTYGLNSSYLYQRFGLFVLPAYAWAFCAAAAQPQPGWRPMLAMVALVAGNWLVLGNYSLHGWRFDRESAPFESVLRQLRPGQRALYLPLDKDSAAYDHRMTYLHHASWYQAEKSGFVDFNFAWFPPQIARFKADRFPPVQPVFPVRVEQFDWQQHQGDLYTYFIVRSMDDQAADKLFVTAPCRPKLVIRESPWSVYERRSCP